MAYYFFRRIEGHFEVNEQLLTGWLMAGAIIVLYRTKLFHKSPYRVVLITLGGLISFRYLVWRTFDTLVYIGPADMVGMIILFAAEVYALSNLFLGMFINIWPREHKPVALPADPAKCPTVDVFIPTYTESLDIVKITAVAAMQIDYPAERFRVFILDDGSTVARRNNPKLSAEAWQRHYELKKLAADIGATYLTRQNNLSAKAGNINHALAHTGGELILTLDCDHVPTRDILKKTAGCFLRDKNLYLVQTPHFFINPAPVERNMDSDNVPYESDMFFRVMQSGLNSWNASYYCGLAALLRRKHLLEVGGVAGKSITEDAETSVILHGRGYNSAFINEPMICGLSPETFDDYILQRTRWCQGMLQIMLLRNPLLVTGMSLAQRVCYFNSCLFWFFSFARLTFFLAPALFLILGLKVYHATLPQIVAYAVPHLISTYTMMMFFYGRFRLPFVSEVYESVQSIFLFPAVISVLLKPSKPTFKITPKGKRLEATYLNSMATTFFMVVLLNVVALPEAYMRWVANPLYRNVILLASFWCVYNIIISVSSLGAFWEKKQIRRHHRIGTKGKVEVFFPTHNQTVKGAIKDLSLNGMGVEMELPFRLGELDEGILMVSDSYGESYEFRAKASRIIKRGGKVFCGFDFVVNDQTYPAIVRYIYGDSQRWSDIWDSRAEPKGSLKSVGHFLVMGLRASGKCFISLVLYVYGRAAKALRYVMDVPIRLKRLRGLA